MSPILFLHFNHTWNDTLALGYRAPQSQRTHDNGEDDPELQEAIRRSLYEDGPPSTTTRPQQRRGPVGFEHLESEARRDNDERIGFEHLESDTRDGNNIGFDHLNREAPVGVRHRSHGLENTQMSPEQLRAARIARFERSNY